MRIPQECRPPSPHHPDVKLSELLPHFRILLAIQFVLGLTLGVFGAWLWATTADFALTLSQWTTVFGLGVALFCAVGSIADRRASKSIIEMSEYGAAVNKYKEVGGLTTFIGYQVICLFEMGVAIVLGGQALFYKPAYEVPAGSVDFDELARQHEIANLVTLKIYVAGLLCVGLAAVCFFLIMSVLHMMREEGERIKTVVLLELLLLSCCAVMMHVIDHLLNHAQVASALYGGIFTITETLVIGGAWVILLCVLLGSCLVSTESHYGLKCYLTMLSVVMCLYVALLYLQFHARAAADQHLSQDCYDVMSLLHESEVREMGCPSKYKQMETQVAAGIDYGYPGALCPKSQVRVAWEQKGATLRCLNKACCGGIVGNLASESDVSILLTIFTIAVGVLTLYGVYCFVVKLSDEARHQVARPGPTATSPLQWVIGVCFLIFASLLVFSLFFKTRKDFLMMKVDEVKGNPTTVSHPELWRVGEVVEPGWAFLGDTSLGLEGDAERHFALSVQSAEAEVRISNATAFDATYFSQSKAEWTDNGFVLEAGGTVYTIEKAVRLLQYRAKCPGTSGMIQINIFDANRDEDGNYEKEDDSILTLKKPIEQMTGPSQILQGAVTGSNRTSLAGAAVLLKSPDFPRCGFNATLSNKYGHFEAGVPLLIRKNSKKPIPYAIEVEISSEGLQSGSVVVRVGEQPLAARKELGEIALLSHSQQKNAEFYTNFYDARSIQPLEDVAVTVGDEKLLSNKKGGLVVDGLKPGFYSLKSEKENYMNDTWHVAIESGYKKLPNYYLLEKKDTTASTPSISVSAFARHRIELLLTWDSELDLDLFLIFDVSNKLTCIISYAQRVCGGAVHKFEGNGTKHNMELVSIETVTNTNYLAVVTPHSDAKTQPTNARLQVTVGNYEQPVVELKSPTGAQNMGEGEKGGDVWLAFCLAGAQGVKSITPLNAMVGKVPLSARSFCTNRH